MTKQDLNNIALTDEELEAAAGGAGQWVAPSRGSWWVWKESASSVSGDASSFHQQSSSSTGTVRSELAGGKTNFYKFDGTKEILVGSR
ncbi:hypothetical protein AB4Z10_03975 [Bosea sp. RAF48]|uniref:hypothetical protein n=1 Tax=Bosea sp. RAF48 TaxID=3237480 RepID=UPI003F93757C